MNSSSLSRTWDVYKPAACSKSGVICSQNRIASEIGIAILQQGGNAIDAAIATSFALGVTEPWMSGIGGGGCMVIRQAKGNEVKVIDFGMKAPKKLELADYPLTGDIGGDLFSWPKVKEDRNLKGAKAVAIPTHVAGMGLAHSTYASLPWNQLLKPSIELAAQGISIDWYCQLILSGVANDLSDCPNMRATFFDENGFTKASSWTALGESRSYLKKLSSTLEKIAEEGYEHFYKGTLASLIIEELQSLGGRHCTEDFADYQASIVDATKFDYRGHKIYIAPELTAGPTLRHAFNELENTWSPKGMKPDAEAYLAYEKAIRSAYAQRYVQMGDCINEPAPSCTTHFNVIDKHGNMVSVTQTLLSIFGAKIMLPNSGIIMNNGIMWFDPEPGKPNSLQANKRCLSNMCPAIVQRSDGTNFAIGSAGGRKIMPAVSQLTSFLLDYNMDITQAISTPRLDMSNVDVTIADDKISPETYHQLQQTIKNIVPARRTVYPYNFAYPSIAALSKDYNGAVTETSSPWAESIAQNPL